MKKSKPEDGSEKPEEMTLEEALKSLDDLIGLMEDENLTLEDSFKNYKKGLELISFCHDSIGKIEGELRVIEDGGE